MKKKYRSLISAFFLILLGVLVMLGISFCIYFYQMGVKYYDEQATNIARGYVREIKEINDYNIARSEIEIRDIAEDMYSTNGEDYDLSVDDRIGKDGLFSVHVLKNGEVAKKFGGAVEYSMSVLPSEAVSAQKPSHSTVYTEKVSKKKLIAFYCPVRGLENADGIIGYFEADNVVGGGLSLHEKATYYCLAKSDGSIDNSLHSDGTRDPNGNVFEYIHNQTQSKADTDAVMRLVSSGQTDVVTVSIGTEKYIVGCFEAEIFGEDRVVLQSFADSDILKSEQVMSEYIFVLAAGVIVVALTVLIFCIVFVNENHKRMLRNADIDPVLGCSNYNKFSLDTETLMEQNRFTRYAVVNFEIYRYEYLREHISQDESEKILKYLSKTTRQLIDNNETLGYVLNSSFVVLMHYGEQSELRARINLLSALLSNYATSQKINVDLRLSSGAYLVENYQRNIDVQRMFDGARVALQVSNKRGNDLFTVYDATIASAYMQQSEFEVKMGGALKNKDFKLFFQPKYSIKNNCVESAEVLVRWYNSEKGTYIAPDMFIRLFEANGFISQLDKFVFEETCIFLKDQVKHGEKKVPLSVNVSRATAMQVGFLNFYVSKKREYGIPDGYLTLEFTETFASEDREALNAILQQLRANGFKCSIDDFGMGNSSMVAVKEMPVDELKFDRALIQKGDDLKKDNLILKLMIDVAKELGKTVVQEGVETKEDMDRMRELGCDVIQGYYYSKPMPLVDFIDFLKDDTSLEGVIRFRKH